jgi:protein transport protein SEC61 subunit alpha
MPIILQTALVSNYFFISQLIWRRLGDNLITNIIGAWQQVEGAYQQHSIPVGGIAYYLSPPNTFSELLRDPLHTIIYLVFVLARFLAFAQSPFLEIQFHFLQLRALLSNMD